VQWRDAVVKLGRELHQRGGRYFKAHLWRFVDVLHFPRLLGHYAVRGRLQLLQVYVWGDVLQRELCVHFRLAVHGYVDSQPLHAALRQGTGFLHRRSIFLLGGNGGRGLL